MANPLIRIESAGREWWLVWSTVVDAPITYGMTEAELTEWVREEWGKEGLRGLPDRIARARASGTSAHVGDLDGYIACNRAGEGETRLTLDQIVAMYCLQTGDVRGVEWWAEDDEVGDALVGRGGA